MKKLIAGLLAAAFAFVAVNAYAGHGTGNRDDDGKGKKHGKKHAKEDKGAEKTEKADDAKK